MAQRPTAQNLLRCDTKDLVANLKVLRERLREDEIEENYNIAKTIERESSQAELLIQQIEAEISAVRHDLADLHKLAARERRHTEAEREGGQAKQQEGVKQGLIASKLANISALFSPRGGASADLTKEGKSSRGNRDVLTKAVQLQAHWDQRPFDAVIFEGGGSKGIAFAGAVQRLAEAGLMDGVRGFAGTSAGAQVAMLAAVGYGAEEIRNVFLSTDYEALFDRTKLFGLGCVPNVYRLFRQHGWCKGQALQEHLEQLVAAKVGPKFTFQRLYVERGVELKIGVCDVTTRRFEVLDRHSTPNMLLSVAVRAACGIPFYYVPVAVSKNGKTHLLVDGGVEGGMTLKVFPGKHTLALDLLSGGDWGSKNGTHSAISGMWQYGQAVADLALNASTAVQGLSAEGTVCHRPPGVQVVRVHGGQTGALETRLPEPLRRAMWAAGWDAVDDFLETATAS